MFDDLNLPPLHPVVPFLTGLVGMTPLGYWAASVAATAVLLKLTMVLAPQENRYKDRWLTLAGGWFMMIFAPIAVWGLVIWFVCWAVVLAIVLPIEYGYKFLVWLFIWTLPPPPSTPVPAPAVPSGVTPTSTTNRATGTTPPSLTPLPSRL